MPFQKKSRNLQYFIVKKSPLTNLKRIIAYNVYQLCEGWAFIVLLVNLCIKTE
jgi:hypothetical protein